MSSLILNIVLLKFDHCQNRVTCSPLPTNIFENTACAGDFKIFQVPCFPSLVFMNIGNLLVQIDNVNVNQFKYFVGVQWGWGG